MNYFLVIYSGQNSDSLFVESEEILFTVKSNDFLICIPYLILAIHLTNNNIFRVLCVETLKL